MSQVRTEGRKLSVVAYVVVAIVYLVIVQGLGQLLTADIDTKYASPTSIDELWRGISVPVGVGLLFVAAVIVYLRWWRPILVDDKPVQRWVSILPIIMLIVIVAGTNYAGLADRGLAFAALLLVTALFVGFAEEALFRGIGIVTFRTNGFTEGKVALWTCIIFGLAHSTNIISEGPKAFIQVLVTAIAGYFFYLIRRRAGGLVVPAFLHGLWDFGLLTASVVPDKSYFGPALFILADIVLAIIVLVRRHHIEPVGDVASAPDPVPEAG